MSYDEDSYDSTSYDTEAGTSNKLVFIRAEEVKPLKIKIEEIVPEAVT